MSPDAVPGNGKLPGAAGPYFSPREIYFLLLSVAVVVATYVIGGFPLGYLRFPIAVYWLVTGARYLQATRV